MSFSGYEYNDLITEKQLRVAKLMELFIKLDYNCKNKKKYNG